MRIFITGASGFIGSRVLPLLEGHEMLCLVQSPQDVSKTANVRPLLGDLAQPDKWRVEAERFAPEWCMHLAWEGLPDYSISRCRRNLDASIGLIEMLVDIGVQRIVVAGSCWEYGSVSGAVKEDHIHIPNDCGMFAATKRSLQMMLDSVARDRGIEYRWGRIFFAYGPNQRATSLIPQCHADYSKGLTPEIRNPELIQDFIYVDDVAKGLVAIAQAEAVSGVYNIGSGIPAAVGHVANRVAGHFDKPPLFSLQGHRMGFWADVSKITAATGWKAQIPIDEGVARTLRTLDDNL